jgi:hypothetical protein
MFSHSNVIRRKAFLADRIGRVWSGTCGSRASQVRFSFLGVDPPATFELAVYRMAFLLLALAGVPTPSLAVGAPVIFADGFESGDTCAWQGTCPAPSDVSGVWVGSLDFAVKVPGTWVLMFRNISRCHSGATLLKVPLGATLRIVALRSS